MSERLSRVLDVIDAGLQTPMPDPTYGEVSPTVSQRCARCERHDPVEGGDLCEGCRSFLLGDSNDDPNAWIDTYLGPQEFDHFINAWTGTVWYTNSESLRFHLSPVQTQSIAVSLQASIDQFTASMNRLIYGVGDLTASLRQWPSLFDRVEEPDPIDPPESIGLLPTSRYVTPAPDITDWWPEPSTDPVLPSWLPTFDLDAFNRRNGYGQSAVPAPRDHERAGH